MRRGLIVIALSVLVVGTAPLAAQELISDNGMLDMPAEVAVGSCTPGSVGAEELVTCRLPLVFPGDELPDWGIKGMLTAADVPDWGLDFRQSLCHLDGDFLVCPDLLPDWEEGSQQLYIDLSYDVPLAEIVVERTSDGVLGLAGLASRLPVAFAGEARTIEVFRSFRLPYGEVASLLVRRVGSDTVVDEVPALGEQDEFASVAVTFPEAGRWTITGCLVQAEGGCAREGFRRQFNVIEPDAHELIPGHNLTGADRINMLFVGSGWVGERDEFVAASRRILALDGYPIRQSETGEEAAVDEPAVALGWGPFSIDPMRGNAYKFNFWYLEGNVESSAFTRAPTSEGIEGLDLAPLGLGNNVATVIMNRTAAYTSIVATANHPSFLGEIEPGPTAAIRFGSTELPFFFRGSEGATTFSHELGHLLFALADEYVQWETDLPTYGYPNCAETQAEATEWWGDLEGDLDPMFDRWKETEQAEGTWWWDDSIADSLRIGFVEGGCFSESDAALRPTADGLMNSEVPVFGAVNRRRAQAVLDLWSGRAAFDLDAHQGVGDCRVPFAAGSSIQRGLMRCCVRSLSGRGQRRCSYA